MKGSLHTDEMMRAVMQKETGLRTSRRVSHVFVMDTPAYERTLLITDAAINIYPTLEDKVDIVQNAILLAHALGIPEPKVALLSAVETESEDPLHHRRRDPCRWRPRPDRWQHSRRAAAFDTA
jgi:phosphate acetyltransferase